jgi:hypothetical protein
MLALSYLTASSRKSRALFLVYRDGEVTEINDSVQLMV